ncbi:MAG: hypothetical protein R3A52_13780 [Polyangiales bacterium]
MSLDDDLSPESMELLRHAERPRARTEAERRRTAASVARIASAPVAAGAAWLSWKGAALAAALLTAGAVTVTAARRDPASAPRPARAPDVVALARPPHPPPVYGPVADTPRAVPMVAPAPRAAAPDARRPSPRRPVASREVVAPAAPPVAAGPAQSVGAVVAPVARPREDVLRALERARALLADDPAESLRVVDALPRGDLDEERELIAVDALRRLSRDAAMRARGTAFLERFPRSLYAERVRRWL